MKYIIIERYDSFYRLISLRFIDVNSSPLDKMAAISQTTFLNKFSSMKKNVFFDIKYH